MVKILENDFVFSVSTGYRFTVPRDTLTKSVVIVRNIATGNPFLTIKFTNEENTFDTEAALDVTLTIIDLDPLNLPFGLLEILKETP